MLLAAFAEEKKVLEREVAAVNAKPRASFEEKFDIFISLSSTPGEISGEKKRIKRLRQNNLQKVRFLCNQLD